MRVHVVDPSAYTPPYDDALCRALGAAGAEVELYTSRFAYGPVAPAVGYARHEFFYRAARGEGRSRLRVSAKLAQHVPDMLRYRRAASAADVVHFQWLTIQHVDGHLLPRRRTPTGGRRPLVVTAHDVLPREPRRGQREAQRRLYGRFDAVVVHSEHGRRRLTEELGVEPARVHVIPHGVLRPWDQTVEPTATGAPTAAGDPRATADSNVSPAAGGDADAEEPSLPKELRGTERPVVLFFGLLRPYKGIDVLLDAWRERGESSGAELWIVGMPRMDIGSLLAVAPRGVRFLARFVSDSELLAVMRRASLVVLPYREIDQSGVAFTALGAGVPLLLSDVGGFPEIAATGAAQTVRAGDSRALGEALGRLLGDPTALVEMTARAHAAAAGEYAWDAIARRTLELYERLLGGQARAVSRSRTR